MFAGEIKLNVAEQGKGEDEWEFSKQ